MLTFKLVTAQALGKDTARILFREWAVSSSSSWARCTWTQLRADYGLPGGVPRT